MDPFFGHGRTETVASDVLRDETGDEEREWGDRQRTNDLDGKESAGESDSDIDFSSIFTSPISDDRVHQAFAHVFLRSRNQKRELENDSEEGSSGLVSDESGIPTPLAEEVASEQSLMEEDEEPEKGPGITSEEMEFQQYVSARHLAPPPSAEETLESQQGSAEKEGQEPAIGQMKLPERLAAAGVQVTEAAETAGESFEQEALWILQQMLRPHRLFSTSVVVAGVIRSALECQVEHRRPESSTERSDKEERSHESRAEWRRAPEILAVAYVLRAIRQEFLEPAHLMMYHMSQLAPLLAALWQEMTLSFQSEVVGDQLAYCSATGRRQLPEVRRGYVGFSLEATEESAIGEGDERWSKWSRYGDAYPAFSIRRPCAIDLGRIAQEIFELDQLYVTLERRRRQVLDSLQKDVPRSGADQRRLASAYLTSESDLAIWETYVKSLVRLEQCRIGALTPLRPVEHIVALGVEDAFEEFALTASNYQDNLEAGYNVAGHCAPMSVSLHHWAEEVAQSLGRRNSEEASKGASILHLFRGAFVQQYASLPLLRAAVVRHFLEHGEVVVAPRRGHRGQYLHQSVSRLLHDSACTFLDVLQQEKAQLVQIDIVLRDPLSLPRLLRLESLFDPQFQLMVVGASGGLSGDEWRDERHAVIAALCAQLRSDAIPIVKDQLLAAAELVSIRRTRNALSSLCALGPFEESYLELSAFTPEHEVWEPWWNVVESLRQPRAVVTPGTARVCAAVCHDDLTTLVSIDERGELRGSMTWALYPSSSVEGRKLADEQRKKFVQLLTDSTPHVIAVTATGYSSNEVFRLLRKDVRSSIHSSLSIDIPVQWTTVEAGHVFASSHLAKSTLGHLSLEIRRGIGVARYVQDPLQLLSMLFHRKEKEVLYLPLSMHPMQSRSKTFLALSDEMVLWTAAVGVDLPKLLTQHPSEALAILQFVPGIGPHTARSFLQRATRQHHYRNGNFESIGTDDAEDEINSIMDGNNANSFQSAPPRCKAAREEVLGEPNGSVALNVTPCIRFSIDIATSRGKRGSEAFSITTAWSPLDRTLIPPTWHGIAEYIASILLEEIEDDDEKMSSRQSFNDDHQVESNGTARSNGLIDLEDHRICGSSKKSDSRWDEPDQTVHQEQRLLRRARCIRFLALPLNKRRACAIAVFGNYANCSRLNHITDSVLEMDHKCRRREQELIVDELIAAGRSYARRTYRLMSSMQLWQQLTGVRFVSRDEQQVDGGGAATEAARSWDRGGATIYADSLAVTTVAGCRDGARRGLRLLTTGGVRAFLLADDITDDQKKEQLLEYFQQRLKAKEVAASEAREVVSGAVKAALTIRPKYPQPPLWCQHKSILYVRVTGVSPTFGELRVKWVEQREAAEEWRSVTTNRLRYKDIDLRAPSREPSLRSSLASVQTQHLMHAAAVTAMKVSTHTVFRNVSHERALQLLENESFGETLIRPSRSTNSRHSGDCVASIKMGEKVIAHWPLREDRNSDGTFRYIVRDGRSHQTHTFESVDHFLTIFTQRLASLVNRLRLHRRFARPTDVSAALEEQLQSHIARLRARQALTALSQPELEAERARRLVYAISEDPQSNSKFLYVFYGLIGGKRFRLPIHIDNKGYYIRLRPLDGTHQWFFAADVESLCSAAKSYGATKRSLLRGH